MHTCDEDAPTMPRRALALLVLLVAACGSGGGGNTGGDAGEDAVSGDVLVMDGPCTPDKPPSYDPSTPTYLSDACDTTANGDAYEYYTPQAGFFAGPNTLLYTLVNDVMVWDVSTPLQPKKLKQVHIPWDWNTITGDGTHGPLINHLGNVGTYPGFPFALVPLGTYGWDFLGIAGSSTAFLQHGYHPVSTVSPGWNSAPLFEIGSTYYAVAQALDDASRSAKDYSLRIYPIGGDSPNGGTIDTATLTTATIGSGYVIPAGHAGDTIDNTTFPTSLGMEMQIFTMSSHTYLLATSSKAPMMLVDISTPSKPLPIAVDGALTGKSGAVDQNGIMWVGINGTSAVNGYEILPNQQYPSSPFSLKYDSVNFNPAGSAIAVNATPHVSSAGGLLVAWGPELMGYITLSASGTPSVIPGAQMPYTYLDSGRSGYPSTCKNNGFSEYFLNASAFTKDGAVYVARSRYVDADLIQISDSCL